ncbi:MAG: signal peptidase I [Actinobacteria bacterium]|nr:signal peptidase I [Actinomycetota bacterium]
MLGAPLEWYHSKGSRDAVALITVSDGEEERSALITSKGFVMVASKDYVVAPKERLDPKKQPVRMWATRVAKICAFAIIGLLAAFAALNAANIVDSRVVLTGSMIPAVNPGDILITVKPSLVAPQVGKIVVYTGKKFDGTVVGSFAHRIIDGDAKTGFSVKGDANPDPDTQKPTLDEIEGVVFFRVPFLGRLLQPQVLMLLLLIGFGISLVWSALRDDE